MSIGRLQALRCDEVVGVLTHLSIQIPKVETERVGRNRMNMHVETNNKMHRKTDIQSAGSKYYNIAGCGYTGVWMYGYTDVDMKLTWS